MSIKVDWAKYLEDQENQLANQVREIAFICCK